MGPQKLPGLFRSIGHWIAQIRRFSTEVRLSSGIDEILKAEGLQGGISELRGIMRSDFRRAAAIANFSADSAYSEKESHWDSFDYDITRERPIEGPDSYYA